MHAYTVRGMEPDRDSRFALLLMWPPRGKVRM